MDRQIRLLIISVAIIGLYTTSYLYLRWDRFIVHYHSWGYEDYHEVSAATPDSTVLFGTASANGEDPMELWARAKWKAQLIDIVYFPLCSLEEVYWHVRH